MMIQWCCLRVQIGLFFFAPLAYFVVKTGLTTKYARIAKGQFVPLESESLLLMFYFRRLLASPNPAKPRPNIASVAGSGTAAGDGPVTAKKDL